MKSPEAARRLEALLARVVARKDAPRTARAPIEAPTPTTAAPAREPESAEIPAPLEPERVPIESRPEASLHPPLVSEAGPDIDMAESTMDIDIRALDVPPPAPTAPEPIADVSEIVDEMPRDTRAPGRLTSLDLEHDPDLARDTHIHDEVILEPEISRVSSEAPTPPPRRMPSTQPPPLPPSTPSVSSPSARTRPAPAEMAHDLFEASELPGDSGAVVMHAAPSPAPKTLRELLARSIALTVRASKSL